MPTPRDQERATAARLLAAVVVDGQTSDQALGRIPCGPLSRDMFYGAMRYYFTLRKEVDAALSKPIRQKDQDIMCLLIVGAYQLRHMRVPDHAAINETVAACKALKKTSLGGLVNGVLRAIQRDNLAGKIPTERSFGTNPGDEFPDWITTRISRDYPQHAAGILTANLERAPLTIRINQLRIAPADYCALLDAERIGYTAAHHREYLVLSEPRPADTLPGFEAGLVAIQDPGAGFVVDVLPCTAGSSLLDACAAPGGKLFHLLECQPDLLAVAVEKSANRMTRLQSEAQRLGHAPITRVADATTLDWWDGSHFDGVLIDAPCSGSGTLRRHPDIKILRKADDLANYSRLQDALLRNLWRTLRPGGSLLYCTCSLFDEENDAVIDGFLAATDDARIQSIVLPTGVPRRFGWQLLPTDRTTDGFYFSVLKKAAVPNNGAAASAPALPAKD